VESTIFYQIIIIEFHSQDTRIGTMAGHLFYTLYLMERIRPAIQRRQEPHLPLIGRKLSNQKKRSGKFVHETSKSCSH
jgi:hypothetical protein